MKASYFSPDVREFLTALHENGVRYLVVGGEAVIYHGHARVANGLDVFFEPSRENAEKLYRALDEYWLGEIPGLRSADELLIPGATVQFGMSPNMIVLQNSLTGVSFEEAWPGRIEENVRIRGKKISVPFIGLEHLIRNKKTLKRDVDKEDLEYLKARLDG